MDVVSYIFLKTKTNIHIYTYIYDLMLDYTLKHQQSNFHFQRRPSRSSNISPENSVKSEKKEFLSGFNRPLC